MVSDDRRYPLSFTSKGKPPTHQNKKQDEIINLGERTIIRSGNTHGKIRLITYGQHEP